MYDHNVVAVRTQPGVHGLADAADFVQGWSMVIRPAKVQHLREEGDCQSDWWSWERRGDERRREAVRFTFGLSWLMS